MIKEENKVLLESELDKLFEKTTSAPMIHECIMHVENGDGSFCWNKGYGGRTVDTNMNLASVTKLFTTTCIINLIQQGKLSLDDCLSKFFGDEILDGIHVYKGKDYSKELTVRNLLFQNTGFPDVFAVDFNKINRRMQKEDFSVSFEEYVELARTHKKKFAPGTPGKAHYSDLNFEMLGKIIEQLEKSSLHEAYKKYIFIPLQMENTALMEKESDVFTNMYYKDKAMYLPKLWMSIPASGGGRSTTREMMKFLKAFFAGKLFDAAIFHELRKFAMIQYCPPIGQYGGGFIRLNIEGIGTLYQVKGELIGHMGGSGTFAYYYPEKDLYIVGDVNQFAKPGLTFTVPLTFSKLAYRYG